MDTLVDKPKHLEVARARVGSCLGEKFRIVRLLGVGGMAAVYEAQHRNGKRVALKVLHRSLDGSVHEKERFLREAYAANTIGHDGVVQIFDDGVDSSGAIYLVMELLEGATLAELQRAAGGRLALDVAIAATERVLDVLAIAHARGVIHRDIKPANLFMTSAGELKVLDFGVARVFEPMAGSTVETQSGVMLGTPAFMPQEQARGRWDEVDARSDIWAVGATLFTLVSGEHVHHAETPNEQLGRAMTMPARSLRSVASDLPEPFIEVVDRALRYERAERWPDARSMQEVLREVARSAEGGERAGEGAREAWASVLAQHVAALSGVTTLSAGAVSAQPPPRRAGARHKRAFAAVRARWVSLALIAVAGAAAVLSFALDSRARPPQPHAIDPGSTVAVVPMAPPFTAPRPVPAPAPAPHEETKLAVAGDAKHLEAARPARPLRKPGRRAPQQAAPHQAPPPPATAADATASTPPQAPAPLDPLDLRY